MRSWEELKSDKALVCKREINCEHGGATVWMVLLSDGHLVDCGSGKNAHGRACTMAQMLNEAGPERLGHKALDAWRPPAEGGA